MWNYLFEVQLGCNWQFKVVIETVVSYFKKELQIIDVHTRVLCLTRGVALSIQLQTPHKKMNFSIKDFFSKCD